MPGIFGLISNNPRQDLAGVIGAMADRMRHHTWYRENRYFDRDAGLALGRMTLGFVNVTEQPAYNEDRTLLAMMEGEILNYAEQRRDLEAAGHRFHGRSHAELLLHGYESQGMKYFRGLRGAFVAGIWERPNHRLILINDRHGLRPLYYVRLPGRLLLASEIKALLVDSEVSRRINPRGVAQFFTYGHLLGEDTFLESVRLLPAAGCLTYYARADRITLERYGRWEPKESNGVTEGEWLDRIDVVFKRAVDRSTANADHLGLSLSGGLDGRSILAVMDHERVPLATISMGMEGSLDVQSARQMAALTNRNHHTCTLDAAFLAQYEQHMRHMVHLTDGQYLCQCIVMPTLPRYRELGIEVLLRGHAGELMHMDKAYNYSLDRAAFALRDEAGLEDWLFRRLCNFMLGETSGPLFANGQDRSMEALARESLRECLRESAGVAPLVQRVSHLFLGQRIRRETGMSLVEFNSLVETRLPYLDDDLVELLLAVPAELKLGDRIQAHILRRRRPEFLDIVNANNGARMGTGSVGLFFAKVRLKVLAKLGVKGYQPYERLGLWLRRELRPFVQKVLLDDRCLERGIFDPQGVQSVVEQHLQKQANHTYLLLAMMIFELGQREFFDGEGTCPPIAAAHVVPTSS